MKHFSEVQKITGLTRKQMQYYEAIDLVKPTLKNEQGYWLYDDAAIGSLITVQLFSQAHYPRRAIKKILTMNQQELLKEFERLEEKLEVERRRIEGMINCIVMMKSICSLPPSVMNMLGEFDISRICEKQSFHECLEQSIEMCAGEKMSEGTDCAVLLSLLAMMHGREPKEAPVQQLVETLFEREADDIIRTFSDEAEEMPPRAELIAVIAENIDEMLSAMAEDEEMQLIDKKHMDAKGWAFAREAVRVYRETHDEGKKE